MTPSSAADLLDNRGGRSGVGESFEALAGALARRAELGSDESP